MTTTLKHGALVLFGSGPGIGQHVASLFASRGLNHVILLSRNLSRLQDDAEAVRSSARPGSTIDTIAADLSETADLERALSQIEGKLEARSTFVETVLYNAARVGESKVLEFPVADFENDFKIAVSGLYTVAQWAIPRLSAVQSEQQCRRDKSAYKPSLLVTGGLLHRDPYPPLFSLSAVKAAQYNLVCTLNKVFAKEGVHCAMILVGGFVGPDQKQTNPPNIAERSWKLYEQDRAEWTREIEIIEPDWEERTTWP